MCFSRKGFSDTTIPDICREAQLSTGAIYRYFKNKEEIIEACVQKHRMDRSRRFTQVEERENVREMLDDLFQMQTLRLRSQEPDIKARIMIHSYGEALTNPQISKIVKNNWDEMNGRLESIIQKAQEKDHIDASLDPRAVAVILTALHDGLLLQKVISSEVSYDRALEVMKEIFMAGQTGKPSEA